MFVFMLVFTLALQIGNGAGSSVGRRFFGAFMQNHLADNSLVVDIVSYDKSALVNVSVPGLSFSQSVVLPPFTSTNISIPTTAEITENGYITSKVVSVQSDNDITVWGLSYHTYTTDGFMMIPEQDLGIEYYVVTPVPGTNNEFAILSPYNNVTVQMTLSNFVTFNGVMYTNQLNITLQENQVVMFQAPSLTGTRVFSSAPVAVFSGDWCVAVYSACNFVTEQLLPVGQWGSSYLVFPVSTKSTDDSVVITSLTSADVSVDVSIGGNLTTYTLSNYGHISISVYANQIVSINASTNVGVMYICQGGSSSLGIVIDPFQMTIVPTNKFSNMYLFSTQPNFINILTIIARDADKCGIVMNGEIICDKIQWVTTNDLQFVGGELNLGNGSQLIRVQHASQPFGLYLHGVADYDSFGYMLGYDNIRGGLYYAHLTDTNGSIGFVDLLATPGATDCLWNIIGDAGSAIILRFQSFSLQAGKEFVYVYDGPSTNSPLLGQYSGAGTPGPIISSSNTLIIIATYTTQIVGNFSAFYRVGSPCKQSFTGSQGQISSNNFSAVNERNALCWWSIEVDPKYEVKLRFQTFNLTADPDCVNESLTVYENLNSLGVFCGSLTPPGLRSTTNKLLLVLDSLQGLQQNAVTVNYQIINPIKVSTSCGIANVSGLSAWPWQVNVTRLLDNARCIGSLVSNSLVVTAAHCLQESPNNYTWSCETASGEQVNVTSVMVHEKFYPGNRDFDFALLNLSWPVTFDQRVQAVCLPWQHEQSPVQGRTCHALGLRSSDGSLSAPAAEGNVQFVNKTNCAEVQGNFTSRMMCAAKWQGWADSCQLGQGGGLHCLGTDGKWYLTGIDSLSANCANATQHAVYSNVWRVLSWIKP